MAGGVPRVDRALEMFVSLHAFVWRVPLQGEPRVLLVCVQEHEVLFLGVRHAVCYVNASKKAGVAAWW